MAHRIRRGLGAVLALALNFAATHAGLAAAFTNSGAQTGTAAAPGAVAPGTIEGRVLNTLNGSYVEGARITIAGTAIETLTDSDGRYRLSRVPEGGITLTVAYTGFAPQTERVAVVAGQTSAHDINLGGGTAAQETGIVKLDQFVVETRRAMDGAAIAINEQRIAPNIKNVVSTDEFGDVAEGNVAEFLKFMPGVAIQYNGGTARGISIDGVPPNNVPVTLDGFTLASAPLSGNVDRAAQMDIMSLNNLSRIEVSYTPTPESQGSALAGSVNMIPRSAFERPRPILKFSTFLIMRDNARDFNKTPGPRQTPTRKVNPGADFSYLVPVNKRFGFTLSGGTQTQYSDQSVSQNSWRGSGSATNSAFAATTPDNPYLSGYTLQDSPKSTRRSSFGATVDFKLTNNDRVSFSFQLSTYKSLLMGRTLTINAGAVAAGNYSPTTVRGNSGAGTLTMTVNGIERANRTYMPTLVWRHNGPIWKAEAGAGVSHASNRNRDIDKGYLASASASRTGVTVSFDDITYLRPGTIAVVDAARAPVDPFSLATYTVNSATSNQNNTDDARRSAYFNLRRDFTARLPISVKAGLDVRESSRDVEALGTLPLTFTGANRNAAPFLDPNFSLRPGPYGLPRIDWLSAFQLWSYYEANPARATINQNNAYRSLVSGSKYARELISAAFIRGDVQMLENRLKLVGGVRAEQTNIDAEGPLSDPSRNVQRNSAGQPILGANGRPLPITTDALASSVLTFLRRGARAEKEYLRLFPSINASYNLRENLVARAGYYYSVGRPNYNQYTGGLTLPDLENLPSSSNRITVTNVGVKAWRAKSLKVRLEYYLEGVGQISVGAFRRDFQNFFGTAVSRVTPDILETYGLDPAAYGEYDVSTQYNITAPVRIEGVDVSYRQALTFLPSWARGVQVFANGSATHAKGDGLDSYTDRLHIPLSASWGASLTREKFNLHLNWNWRGTQRRDAITGASIGPDVYDWTPKRLSLDVSGECYLRKNTALFVILRNLTDVTEDVETYGASTPAAARLRTRTDYGSLWQIGLKATF